MFDKLDHLQYLRYLKSIQNNRSHLITSLAFLVICKFTRLFSVSSNFLFMITQRWLDISFLLFPVGFNFCYKVSIFSIFILIDDNAVLFYSPETLYCQRPGLVCCLYQGPSVSVV